MVVKWKILAYNSVNSDGLSNCWSCCSDCCSRYEVVCGLEAASALSESNPLLVRCRSSVFAKMVWLVRGKLDGKGMIAVR